MKAFPDISLLLLAASATQTSRHRPSQSGRSHATLGPPCHQTCRPSAWQSRDDNKSTVLPDTRCSLKRCPLHPTSGSLASGTDKQKDRPAAVSPKCSRPNRSTRALRQASARPEREIRSFLRCARCDLKRFVGNVKTQNCFLRLPCDVNHGHCSHCELNDQFAALVDFGYEHTASAALTDRCRGKDRCHNENSIRPHHNRIKKSRVPQ